MAEVRLRRVYEEPQPGGGTRVLVDRLWPRGLAKQKAKIDNWLKAVAPSDELRRWFGHDPAKFDDFTARYLDELADPDRGQALRELRGMAAAGPVTLLTATKDLQHSQAAVLARLLDPGPGGPGGERGDAPCWLNRVCPECGSIAGEAPPARCPNCHADIPAG
ncbi:MAG TPA: DUF488 family protein [Streptosporangiaceae bacterium]|jgi:uncharacterized protein YeaO (DUF488 family)